MLAVTSSTQLLPFYEHIESSPTAPQLLDILKIPRKSLTE